MNDKKTIKITKKIMGAMVSIVISKQIKELEKEIKDETKEESAESKKEIVNLEKKELKMADLLADKNGLVEVGNGSGFIVDSNGIILTNKHVVEDKDANYVVVLNDDRKFDAEIISRDPINDIAILKIEAVNLPFIKLGDASKLQLGQSLIAVGNALGIFRNTVSVGIVSGLSRSIMTQTNSKYPPQEMRGLIQTDAAINPGNSGGPLINENGEAVGINSAIVSGAQNIGFAIPINSAIRDLKDIKKFGKIRRPFLGIRYIMIDDNLKEKMNLPINYGALVIKEDNEGAVIKNSPSEKAGIIENDIILSFNGEKLKADHPIQDILENMSAGDVIKLDILRNGKQISTELTLAERK
jgi:S1-C subfamily serine protease